MPKPEKSRHDLPAMIQLPLFPEGASLIRIRPERNEWRYYCLAVWPDLFGRALLARRWGRIFRSGRIRLNPHPDAGAALSAPARLIRMKRCPGYRDQAAWSHAGERRRRRSLARGGA